MKKGMVNFLECKQQFKDLETCEMVLNNGGLYVPIPPILLILYGYFRW